MIIAKTCCECGGSFLSTKGREGPRRTATATPFSTEDTENHGELQLQLLFFPRRTRRITENCNCKFLLSTKGREGPRRAAKNGNCNFLLSTKGREELQLQLLFSTEDTEDHGEGQRQLPFFREGPRSNAKNCNCNTFVHGGHGGPRRTATATSFFPRRTRRTTENGNGNFFLSTVIAKPQWLTGRSFLERFRLLVTGLVCGRGYGGQRTGCDEGRRWVRDGFVGGRCGGAAPAQGRAEGPTAHNTIMRGEGTRLLASFWVGNQVRLRSC